jgi:hypothetical protein
MATARKTPAWRVMTFQKTSAKPRERNHWRSTQEERMVVELKMRARRMRAERIRMRLRHEAGLVCFESIR